MQTKQMALAQLAAEYNKCQACPLARLGRTQVVFGEGNPDTSIMLIGGGPGQNEDIQGRPFVGRSGQLLTRILEQADLSREELYITNIVKCRPPNNRKPLPIESKTCRDLLLIKQLHIIQPHIVITLGAAALEGLLGQPVKISKIRGKPLQLKQFTILPTYHPAYILRNPKEAQTLLEDIQLAQRLSQKKTPDAQ